MASASVTCADGPASCDAAAVWLAPLAADGDDDAPLYATPAVVDCPAPAVPAVLQTLVGECDGTPLDFAYRASRYPESEQARGSLAPGKQGRERHSGIAACDRVPPAGAVLTLSPVQPVALFALPALVLATRDAPPPAHVFTLVFRATDPPERPPRV